MRTNLAVNFGYNQLLFAQASLQKSISVQKLLAIDFFFPNFFSALSMEDEKKIIEQSKLIKQTIKQNKLLDLDTNVLIPDSACSLQLLNIPLVSEKEIISAIEFQAEEFIPYPFEKAAFDYQIISIDEKSKQMSVFVVATLKDVLDRITEFVLDIGLFPSIVEPRSTAIYRLFLENYYTAEAELIMFLNCHHESTQLSILDLKNKQLVATLSLNFGSYFFIKAVANNLNLNYAEAVKNISQLKFDSPTYTKILRPLYLEFDKEINKVLFTANEKIGLAPKKIYLTSNALQNSIVDSLNEIQESAKDKYLPIDLKSKLCNIKLNVGQEEIGNLDLNSFLPSIASLI